MVFSPKGFRVYGLELRIKGLVLEFLGLRVKGLGLILWHQYKNKVNWF